MLLYPAAGRRARWARLQVLGGLVCLALACAAPRLQTGQPSTPAPPPGSGGVNRPEHLEKPHLILISLDGFKPAYLDRFTLPNIKRVVSRGARAGAMIPVFPSLTFPNLYSLVTGLHPERHGIVANSFYDPAFKESYSLSNRRALSDAKWYRGEPVWVTAETQGMVAACYFWPGSEAPIGGVRPTFWRTYEGGIPNDDRVRTVLEWLRLPAERRPHLITLYFSELDSASHDGPVDSRAVGDAARSLDKTIGALLDGIATLSIRDRVYVLLTSDHGMVDTTPSQEVVLDSLVEMSRIASAFSGPVASLHVRGDVSVAREIRDQLNTGLRHGRAYLRQEMPHRFHYRADPRAGDVVVVMDESWTLITGLRRVARPFLGRRGMHGWDPELPSMHALFVAAGPGIPAGINVPEVHNVDVYPLMTELLGLRTASDIDGRPGWIRRLISTDAAGAIASARQRSY